jgi:hypothetical protein
MEFISTLAEKILSWELSDNYNKFTVGIEHENVPEVLREFGGIYHIKTIYETKYVQLLMFGKKDVRISSFLS